MGLFKNIQKTVGNAGKILENILQSYIEFNTPAKQLILKPKTVTFLCRQVESKIEQIISLTPDDTQGLIAIIQQDKIEVKLHFKPKLITLKEDCIEGELQLLKQPDIQSDSLIYKTLIGGWKIFLGGYIPQNVLPEKIKVMGDKIYYTLPRNEVKLLEVLFKTVTPGSTLFTDMKAGELIIESAIAVNGNDVNLSELISILKLKSE
jgi:hypothetical protein